MLSLSFIHSDGYIRCSTRHSRYPSDRVYKKWCQFRFPTFCSRGLLLYRLLHHLCSFLMLWFFNICLTFVNFIFMCVVHILNTCCVRQEMIGEFYAVPSSLKRAGVFSDTGSQSHRRRRRQRQRAVLSRGQQRFQVKLTS